jgi:serine/threonine-protein kinase
MTESRKLPRDAPSDATIAIRQAPPDTDAERPVFGGNLPLDSYQPPDDSLTGSFAGPEHVGPSRATVAAILDWVRRPVSERLAIESRVASGGMGAIDVGVDRALDRRIAVKTLHRHLRSDDASVRMFLREARLTGLLDHPHIVPVYEVGERPDDGGLFFSMKLVQGQTLGSFAEALPRRHDTASLYALLDVVSKVCDALAFAHSRGVLHCDIKPANVMVGEFGQVFLMDWGIARFLATEVKDGPHGPRTAAASSTGRGKSPTIIGTPCYMSPEQARGERDRLDARSDVFLVGATIYELLTHRAPYASGDSGESLALAAAGSFPSPRKLVGDVAVPLELERIVLRAMAKEPRDRYPTIGALKEDLVRFMRGGAEFPSRSYAAGEHIIREGEQGDAAYILVEGRCEVRKEDGGTLGPALKTIEPGEVFGEMAILTEGARTASVVATQPTTVLVVTSQVLEQEVAALKPWMARLLKSLATRFRDLDTQNRVTAPTSSPSTARVANQVLMTLTTWGQHAPDGSLSMKWSAIAGELESQLGVVPVALFAAIARYGLVLDMDADVLSLPDPTDLRTRLRDELALE